MNVPYTNTHTHTNIHTSYFYDIQINIVNLQITGTSQCVSRRSTRG